MKYTLIDLITNTILRHGVCSPSAFDLQAKEGQKVVEGSYPDHLFFYDGEVFHLREPFETTINKTEIQANGIDACHIEGVPNGALVSIQNVGEQLVYDGEVYVTSDIEGVIVIELSHKEYQNHTYIVEAV